MFYLRFVVSNSACINASQFLLNRHSGRVSTFLLFSQISSKLFVLRVRQSCPIFHCHSEQIHQWKSNNQWYWDIWLRLHGGRTLREQESFYYCFVGYCAGWHWQDEKRDRQTHWGGTHSRICILRFTVKNLFNLQNGLWRKSIVWCSGRLWSKQCTIVPIRWKKKQRT